MADISYKYRDTEHRIDSYDNVVSTYDWIRDALRFTFEERNDLTLNCVIAFDSEDMSYECKSIDEFKKYAFGKTIRVKNMTVYVSKNWIQTLVSIYVNRSSELEPQEFILSSEDEMLVISLRDALHTNKKPERRKENVTVSIEDNSVRIGNNNQISNSIIGSTKTAEIGQETVVPEHKEESLASKSFWKIFVPILVIVVGAAICVWLKLN